jgi:hypothetical protein
MPRKPRKNSKPVEKSNPRSASFHRELDKFHITLNEVFDWGYEAFYGLVYSKEEAEDIVERYKAGEEKFFIETRKEYVKFGRTPT